MVSDYKELGWLRPFYPGYKRNAASIMCQFSLRTYSLYLARLRRLVELHHTCSHRETVYANILAHRDTLSYDINQHLQSFENCA